MKTETYTMIPIHGIKPLEFDCPADKSLTHRAIIFSSLAKGVSTVLNPLLGDDCLATFGIFRELGVDCQLVEDGDKTFIKIISPGWKGFKSPDKTLDCGNSGTTARLLVGLFSSIPGLVLGMTGDESLQSRPMGRIVDPLLKMGASITYIQRPGYLPIRIEGKKLQYQGKISIDKASAQVKSGLLLSLFHSQGTFELSIPSGARNHTEVIMEQMGGNIVTTSQGGMENICFAGPFMPQSGKFLISGDPSSAAFFIAYAAMRPGMQITINGVLKNSTRNGFLEVVKRMGVKVKETLCTENFIEPTVNLHITGPNLLLPAKVSKLEIPTLIDELPILAVLSMFASGESFFEGVEELRFKESDRLAAIEKLVATVSGQTRVVGDNLYVSGGLGLFDGFEFDPKFDHRLFMAAAILASLSQSESKILDKECVDVSFPTFFSLLDSLR